MSPLFLCVTSFFFLLQVALSSSPMADDYCMAYGAHQFGVLSSFSYLNAHWTPSVVYLYSLGIWALPFNSHSIAALVGLSSLAISTILLIVISRSLLAFLKVKSYLQATSILLLGFIGSLAFVQYEVFRKTISDGDLSPFKIAIHWFQAFFMQLRDGQLLLWMYSTSLTSTRVTISALIILYVIKSNTTLQENQVSNFIKIEILPLLIAIIWGLTTESFILITYIVVKNFIRFKSSKFAWKFFFILAVSTSGIGLIYISPGAQYRNSFLGERSLIDFILFFGAHLWQMGWILMATALIAWITSRIIGTYTNPGGLGIPKLIKRNLTILALAAVFTQIFIGTVAYTAAYHWTACIWITYICFVAHWIPTKNQTNSKEKTVFRPDYIFSFYSIFLILTLAITANSASERRAELDLRSEDSLEINSAIMRVINPRDNNGNFFGTDLNPTAISIIPFKGYRENSAGFCYKNLPVGF